MVKKIIVLLAILVTILILFGLGKQISEALQAGSSLDKATDNLSKLQEENQSLKQRLKEVENPLFIEKIARDKLNLAKPNEIVVIISESELQNILTSKEATPEAKMENWQGWLNLIFHLF